MKLCRPPRIVLVHGFNVRDKGANTVDRLKPILLEKYPTAIIDTDSADYGWHGLIKVRFFYKEAVERIASAIAEADMVVTHSNGANYTHKALRLLEKQGRPNSKLHVIHFSPALNRIQNFKEISFQRMDTFCSQGDKIVWLAKLLLLHPWGNAGQKGFITNDPRVLNHEYKRHKHSTWFKPCQERLHRRFIQFTEATLCV